MKRIGITQKITFFEKGKRDVIESSWYDFFKACDLLPILIPNQVAYIKAFLKTNPLEGYLLSGGNSLVSCGGDAPERDEIERLLLENGILHNLPIFGVCRGMQVIQHFFSIPLERIEGHVRQEHTLIFNHFPHKVNSFHEYGTKQSSDDFEILAKTEEGVIEAIKHRSLPIQAIMWHPERNEVFSPVDIDLIKMHFNS